MEKSIKSYGNRILVTGLLWAIAYLSCLLIVKELDPGKTLGIILSFLPAACFALFIFHYIKGVGAMDELERRIQLEAAVIGFTLAIMLIMTLGLLDLVIILKKEDWGYRHLIPFFVAFYFLGLYITKRKYL